MSWLKHHIDTFVKPVIGEFDEMPLGYFTTDEHTVIKNVWRTIKSRHHGKTIRLHGPLWVFEVLARRENRATKYGYGSGVARLGDNLGLYKFEMFDFFPYLKDHGVLESKIIHAPSYWFAAGMFDVTEDNKEVFKQAARLTIEMYKNSAPAFIPAGRPLTFTDRIVRRLNGDKEIVTT